MNIIEVTTKNQLKDLYDHSAMTWEGLREDSFEKALNLCGGEGAQCYLTTGKIMNELCHLTDDNAYPDDLTIFSIYPFKGLAFQYDARWMDDIIDNNARREGYHPFDETFDDYDDFDDYDEGEDDFDTYYDDEEIDEYNDGIDESLNEAKSDYGDPNYGYPKQFAVFDHEEPEYVTIIEVKDKNEEKELNEYFKWYYIYEIEPIQPGKKSLIANDDESLGEYAINVTDAEWIDLLKKSYQESKEENEGYDDWEESGPLYMWFDEAPQSEEEYIKLYNDWIDDSEVDNDSAMQYRWYISDDVIDWSKYKKEMIDDDYDEVVDELDDEDLIESKSNEVDNIDKTITCANNVAKAKGYQLCNFDDIDEVVEFTNYGTVLVAMCDKDAEDDYECTHCPEMSEDEFWSYLD